MKTKGMVEKAIPFVFDSEIFVFPYTFFTFTQLIEKCNLKKG